jgi:hypothetical protein
VRHSWGGALERALAELPRPQAARLLAAEPALRALAEVLGRRTLAEAGRR